MLFSRHFWRSDIVGSKVMRKKIVFIINPISGTIKKDEIPLMISEEIDADLFDITILQLLKIAPPVEMTGQSLLK